MKYEDDKYDFKKYNKREIIQCTQSILLIFKLLGKLFFCKITLNTYYIAEMSS